MNLILMNVGPASYTHPNLYGVCVQPYQTVLVHENDAAVLLVVEYYEDGNEEPLSRFVEMDEGTPVNFDLSGRYKRDPVSAVTHYVNSELLISPTTEMLENTEVTYKRNTLPFDEWRSNGVSLFTVVQSRGDGKLVVPGDKNEYAPSRIVVSSALPVVNAGNGSTTSATGSILLNSPMPTVYPRMYLILPANALYPGSPAGPYYTEMSSTTVGQVYNNRLAFSPMALPSVPEVKTPISGGTVAAYTAPTTAHIAAYFTLPSEVGKRGRFRMFGRTTQTSSANAKTITLSVGGQTVMSSAVPASSVGAEFAAWIRNRDRIDAQVIGSPGFGTYGGTVLPSYSAIDFSGEILGTISMTMATATEFFALEAFEIEMSPAN